MPVPVSEPEKTYRLSLPARVTVSPEVVVTFPVVTPTPSAEPPTSVTLPVPLSTIFPTAKLPVPVVDRLIAPAPEDCVMVAFVVVRVEDEPAPLPAEMLIPEDPEAVIFPETVTLPVPAMVTPKVPAVLLMAPPSETTALELMLT